LASALPLILLVAAPPALAALAQGKKEVRIAWALILSAPFILLRLAILLKLDSDSGFFDSMGGPAFIGLALIFWLCIVGNRSGAWWPLVALGN